MKGCFHVLQAWRRGATDWIQIGKGDGKGGKGGRKENSFGKNITTKRKSK